MADSTEPQLTFDYLMAKYGSPPVDLTVEIHGATCLLRSGDLKVTMSVPFGEIAWKDVLYGHVLPALAQFKR